ncbi:hypothetical protein D0638_15610 (plasmid) [Lacticaseibacillus paracasei]|nr:hypothetical protein D0638_15610 [Lacticaseibacillus paracasei]
MLCKHHFSKNGQVFFHIFWVVTLIMQSRYFVDRKRTMSIWPPSPTLRLNELHVAVTDFKFFGLRILLRT